jgi:hypothetical protein
MVSLHCSALPPFIKSRTRPRQSHGSHHCESTSALHRRPRPPSSSLPPPSGHGPTPPRESARRRARPPPSTIPPPRGARAAPGLQDRRPLPPVVGVPPAASVPPRTSYAAAGQRRSGAGRRVAVPGDWLLGTGAIPPAEKDSRGQGRGFVAVAGHGVL